MVTVFLSFRRRVIPRVIEAHCGYTSFYEYVITIIVLLKVGKNFVGLANATKQCNLMLLFLLLLYKKVNILLNLFKLRCYDLQARIKTKALISYPLRLDH